MWEIMVAGYIAGPIIGGIAAYWVIRWTTVKRLTYERDCYRTALQVLESNGYFDHKAEELVRQHTPE